MNGFHLVVLAVLPESYENFDASMHSQAKCKMA